LLPLELQYDLKLKMVISEQFKLDQFEKKKKRENYALMK